MKKLNHSAMLMILLSMLVMLSCRLSRSTEPVLGETFRSEEGGYLVNKVIGYEFDEAYGISVMMPPDADPEIGPRIMVYGGLTDVNKSAQELLDEMQQAVGEINFERAKKHVVDGMEGLLTEFSGEYEGELVKGKLFVVPPFPYQEFYILAMAQEGRWPTLAPIFDLLLKSVKFFEASEAQLVFDGQVVIQEDTPVPDDVDVEEDLVDDVIDDPVEEISPYLGDLYVHEQAGFSLRKIKDYDFSDDFGIIQMAKPGIMSYAGPLIMVASDIIEGSPTNEMLLAMAQEDPDEVDTNFSSGFAYVLDGVEGLMVDFTGFKDGEAIKGQAFMGMVTPDRFILVRGIAPEAEWADVFLRFNALLRSIKFDGIVSLPPVEPGEVIRQWAVSAEASSEYSSTNWSAMRATGPPAVDGCADDANAWASLRSDTEEYLMLYYKTPVNPTELVIYQNLNPSQVVEIQFIDTSGQIWVLWLGKPEELACPDVWTHTIELDEVFYTDTVVIFVDQSIMGWGWAEIDAVELVGHPIR